MTENTYPNKVKKQRFLHATLWIEFLFTVLLVVFLFPSSQSLYAIPHSYPPQRIADDTSDNINIHKDTSPDGKQDDSLPVVNPVKEQDVTEIESTEKPGEGEEIEVIEDSEDLTQQDGSEPSDNPDISIIPEKYNGEEVIDATVFRGNPQAGKKVAITFDDGPYPAWTGEYIKVLEEYQVPAVFFLVGTRVEQYPEIARKIVEKGFDIGSHSYRHGRLTLANQELLEDDFRKTIDALSLSGNVRFFRPPYGAYNQMVIETAKKHGLKTIGWNVDPRDWETEDSDKITQSVLSYATEGSVILLHEGRKSTLDALPKIITGLKEKGYQLVTVSELMK